MNLLSSFKRLFHTGQSVPADNTKPSEGHMMTPEEIGEANSRQQREASGDAILNRASMHAHGTDVRRDLRVAQKSASDAAESLSAASLAVEDLMSSLSRRG